MRIRQPLALLLIIFLLLTVVFLAGREHLEEHNERIISPSMAGYGDGESDGLKSDNGKRDPGKSPVVMVWELAGVEDDFNSIPTMEAVNVVSPTWFHLEDGRGAIRSEFDPYYLQWARERDYQIWALVTNSFDPRMTAGLLTDAGSRRQFAGDLVALALEYELEGLNIDFENFHSDYRDYFSLFIEELAELCEVHDLVLSVDVTMISGAEYWCLNYDRRALSKAADYLVLMAYDEHYKNAPQAGSVASLPWVEQGLKLVLEEVPPEKLILGVPFYTRLWEIEETIEPATVLNSWSYAMPLAETIMMENQAAVYYDARSGQNIAEYRKDGLTYRMWLEDSVSMKKRLALIEHYNLAGVAAWRRGLEKQDIWDLFAHHFLP